MFTCIFYIRILFKLHTRKPVCNVIWKHKGRDEEDSSELFISTKQLLLIYSFLAKRQTIIKKIQAYIALDVHKIPPFLFNIALITDYISFLKYVFM